MNELLDHARRRAPLSRVATRTAPFLACSLALATACASEPSRQLSYVFNPAVVNAPPSFETQQPRIPLVFSAAAGALQLSSASSVAQEYSESTVLGYQTALVLGARGVWARKGERWFGPLSDSVPSKRPSDGSVARAPFVRFLLLGENDAVLRVGREGQLAIAAGLEDALANRFMDLGKKVGAIEFVDGAGDHALFVSGSSIWRSNNLHSGSPPSLFETKLKPSLKVVSAFVRADGVAAIVTVGVKNDRQAWLQTGPRGALVKSPYPFSKLDRVGNHIINDRWGCPTILGQDGRSWWAPDQSLDKAEAAKIASRKPKARHTPIDLDAPEAQDVDLEVDGFALPGVRSTSWPTLSPATAWPSPTAPRAPVPRGKNKLTQAALCGGFASIFGSMVSNEGDQACAGVSCVAARAWPKTVAGAEMLTTFDDRECAPADVTVSSHGRPVCREGASVNKGPQLALLGTQAVTLVDAPAGCLVRGTFGGRGLSFAACEATADQRGTRIFGWEGGALKAEGALPIALTEEPSVMLAKDGTLGLRSTEAGRTSYFLRAPAAIGSPEAWVQAPPDTLFALPLKGGLMLALRPGQSPGCASVELVSSAGRRPLAAPTCIQGQLLDVSVTEADTVQLAVHPTWTEYPWRKEQEGKLTRLTLYSDGTAR